MKLCKFIHKYIYSITREEFLALEEKKDNNISFECEEKQLFIMKKRTTTSTGGFITRYVAIDNTTGDLFVEDFKLEDDAVIWLLELKCSEVLQEAEKGSYWW